MAGFLLPYLSALAKSVSMLSSTGGPLTWRCRSTAESCPQELALLCWADGWIQQMDSSVSSQVLCFLGGPTSFSELCQLCLSWKWMRHLLKMSFSERANGMTVSWLCFSVLEFAFVQLLWTLEVKDLPVPFSSTNFVLWWQTLELGWQTISLSPFLMQSVHACNMRAALKDLNHHPKYLFCKRDMWRRVCHTSCF